MNNDKNNSKCDYNDFKRARYFHGQLLTDRDFREEQIYHNGKRKMLNRMMHGWGVVCGLEITPKEGMTITVNEGLALDCAGNEIYVDKPYELNAAEIISACKTKPTTTEECAETEAEETENKWYVIIRYQEVPTDPVPVYTPGGGCEEKACDYSRVREGYCIELIRKDKMTAPCPEVPSEAGKCDNDLNDEDKRELICETLLIPCPDNCCEDEGVVLGSITFTEDIDQNTVINNEMINNWDCRKYVMTFGALQHWMTKLGPENIPLDAIVNYAMLGKACESEQSAVDMFDDICREEEEEQKVTVPNVVNKKKNEAEEIIVAASLLVGAVEYVYNDNEHLHNRVKRQEPAAGVEVNSNSTVKLWVYTNNKRYAPVDIIDGIGRTTADKLIRKGIDNIEKLSKADPKKIAKILSINEEKASNFVLEAKKLIAK